MQYIAMKFTLLSIKYDINNYTSFTAMVFCNIDGACHEADKSFRNDREADFIVSNFVLFTCVV